MEFKMTVEDIIEDIDDITDTLNKYLKRDIENSEDTITIIRDFVNTLDEQVVDEVKLFNHLQQLIDDITEDDEDDEEDDDDEEYYSCERCLSKNISVLHEDEIKDVAVCVCNDCSYEFEEFIIYK